MARIIRKTSPSAQQETKKTVDTTKEESVEAIETEIERLENLPKTDDTVSKIGYCKVKLCDTKIKETVNAKNSIKFTKIPEARFKENICIDGKVSEPDPSLTSLVSGKAYFGKLGYQKIPKNLESLNKQTTRFGNNKQPPKHILDLIK